jgi:cation transport regulator ChaC
VVVDTWIFGYGSLVWRPAFPSLERRTACLDGWTRRFWQGSTDHRGVPGAPGRVVTLVQDPRSRCWGIAYRVAATERARVLAQLDHREQGGYERREVTLRLARPDSPDSGGERVAALVYLATPDNPNYLGPDPLESIAAQVVGAHGPSGANQDYVERLAAELRALGVVEDDDAHVFELARLLAARRAGSPQAR